MSAETERFIAMKTPMVIIRISIGCPVWLIMVLLTLMSSGYAMAIPSELSFNNERYCEMRGGKITRMACGNTTSRRMRLSERPKDRAASHCPALTP
jgi:hypothetical protein